MGTPGGCTAYYHSVSKVWAADFAHAEVKALHKKSNKEGKRMSDKRALRRSEKIKRLYERHRRIHKLLRKYGNDIIHSDNFRKTKRHIQHGNMTVNDHCLSVARHSLILDKKLGLHCNRRDLIRGSLLHDYFLYDWHDKGYVPERGRLYGFTHPNTALRNAAKEYELTDIQRDIIKKHMWPLSVIPPLCREAWVVTSADKYCSLMETLGLHKGHGKRVAQLLEMTGDDTDGESKAADAGSEAMEESSEG